jgi:ATP/maltotriose-dependent transcriptional regulator MalT
MAMFEFDFARQQAQRAEPKALRSKLVYKDGKLSADIYADEIDKLPTQFAPFLNSAAANASESQSLEGDMTRMRREEMMRQYEKASLEAVKADVKAATEEARGNRRFGPDFLPFLDTYRKKADQKKQTADALRRDIELSYNLQTGQMDPLMQPAPQAAPQPVTSAEQPKVAPGPASYASEADARNAGAKTGDVIILQGVGRVRLK